MIYLTQASLDRIEAIATGIEQGLRQREIADRIDMTRGGMLAFLARATGRKGWPLRPDSLRRLLRQAVVIEAQPKPARRPTPSKAFRAERTSLRIALPRDDRPRLDHDEIESRVAAHQAARKAHEAYWLTLERQRHGNTIQTRVGALSGMPA